MACCTSLPYFVTSEREQYMVNSVTDDLLMYDSEDDDSVLRKCLALLTEREPVSAGTADAEDRAVSPSLCAGGGDSCLLGSDGSCCETSSSGPLLNDCMWSAGMLPPDLKAATPPARATQDCVSLTTAEDTDVACTAVDPSLISPCPHMSHQPAKSTAGARHVTSPPPCTSDPGTIHVIACLLWPA